jgi:AhpD family alkylhydroperoxidase
MVESQVEIRNKIKVLFNKYREIMPDIARAYDELPTEVYKDGVLSGKIKRLMALTAALVKGCRACILYQTDLALDQGANLEEIFEACAVAISLGGTMAAGETTRVVQYLHEKGLVGD